MKEWFNKNETFAFLTIFTGLIIIYSIFDIWGSVGFIKILPFIAMSIYHAMRQKSKRKIK